MASFDSIHDKGRYSVSITKREELEASANAPEVVNRDVLPVCPCARSPIPTVPNPMSDARRYSATTGPAYRDPRRPLGKPRSPSM